MILDSLPLPKPKCHYILKQKDVELVTAINELYYHVNIRREWWEQNMQRNGRDKEETIYLQNCIIENNNNKKEEERNKKKEISSLAGPTCLVGFPIPGLSPSGFPCFSYLHSPWAPFTLTASCVIWHHSATTKADAQESW